METQKLTEITQGLITEHYQALANRDLPALAALFTTEPEWFIPGNQQLAPWLGRINKKEEIVSFYQLLFSNVEPITSEIEHQFIDGNHAVVTGNFESKMLATGKVYRSAFFAKFTIENNKIARYYLLEDTFALVQALTNGKGHGE